MPKRKKTNENRHTHNEAGDASRIVLQRLVRRPTRQLERELNEAKQEADYFNECTKRLKDERDQWQQDAEALYIGNLLWSSVFSKWHSYKANFVKSVGIDNLIADFDRIEVAIQKSITQYNKLIGKK